MKIRKKIQKLFAEAILCYRRAKFSHRKNTLSAKVNGLDLCDVFYINLAHRTDRRREIEKELAKIGVLDSLRFEAHRDDNGALGCSRSHHSLLRKYDASVDRLLMICEDDCQFIKDRSYIDELVDEFYTNKNLDVLCLAYNKRNGINISKRLEFTSDTQTTACYILKPHMIPEMVNMANESIDRLESGQENNRAAIDVVWKKLQKKYVFVVPIRRVARQSASYSDIEKAYTDYAV